MTPTAIFAWAVTMLELIGKLIDSIKVEDEPSDADFNAAKAKIEATHTKLLDKFAEINNRYGHMLGDSVLKDVARIISEQSRKTDLACRYGGDEFLIILPHADWRAADGEATAADMVGRHVSAPNTQRVQVRFKETDGEEGVFIIRKH